MSISTEELILSAETLIQSTEPLSERIEKLQQYSGQFDSWFATMEGKLEGDIAPQAQKLLELHTALVEAAEKWLREAGRGIGEHRQKGKAILAYADILPKRISRYRSKKG